MINKRSDSAESTGIDITTGFHRIPAIEKGTTYGKRTYYGGTVEIELLDIDRLVGPHDSRLVKAVKEAFEDIEAKIGQIPLFIEDVRPEPGGKLQIVEMFDAETGRLFLTWRYPFVKNGVEQTQSDTDRYTPLASINLLTLARRCLCIFKKSARTGH
jgi:hypothetical protein